MSALESGKDLAGIGAIFLILSVIPAVGTVLGIVGVILLLIGIKRLSEHYQDSSIYDNALRGVIFFIIGLIAFAAVSAVLLFGASLIPAPGAGVTFLGISILIAAVVILFVFYLLAAMYLRRSFSALAQRTGEHTFETAGLLLFIGAILTIILVGLVLILVAWILATIAFFSIRVPQTQTSTYTPPYPTTSQPTPTRYCPNCGAPVQPNSTFCPNCGKPLPP